MTSMYSKLSDEILIKKINGIHKQCLQLEEKLIYQSKNFDIENCHNMTRNQLENLCEQLSSYQKQLKIELKEKESIKLKNEKQEEEEKKKLQETNVIKYEMINDLEPLKRNFFNPDERDLNYLNDELIKNDYKYYALEYNYSDHMFGKPDYIASNLLKGFIKRMENYSKYIFGVFRCFNDENNNYFYVSYLLFNTLSFEKILEKELDDFGIEQINKDKFMEKIIENTKEKNLNLLSEKYIH